MSNYTKITDFAAKDALAHGNPSKIVTGTGIDNEFNAIATAIASKADSASPSFTGTVTIGGVALTATATELNKLAGSTPSTTEINYLTGVTSAIQTQLNLLAPKANPTFTGTLTAAAVSCTSLSSSGAISGTTGTFSSSVSCTTLTTTGTSTLSGTGRMLNVGDDAALYDINVANTMGIYGQSDSTVGGLKLGSGGPTLSGASGALTVNGNITASDFIISSDARLKKDIRVLQDTGAKIDKLHGYSFVFKDSGVARVGVIAQEVRQVLPEIVHVGGDGYLKVSEGALVALLIEEVKSLRARVATLEAR